MSHAACGSRIEFVVFHSQQHQIAYELNMMLSLMDALAILDDKLRHLVVHTTSFYWIQRNLSYAVRVRVDIVMHKWHNGCHHLQFWFWSYLRLHTSRTMAMRQQCVIWRQIICYNEWVEANLSLVVTLTICLCSCGLPGYWRWIWI